MISTKGSQPNDLSQVISAKCAQQDFKNKLFGVSRWCHLCVMVTLVRSALQSTTRQWVIICIARALHWYNYSATSPIAEVVYHEVSVLVLLFVVCCVLLVVSCLFLLAGSQACCSCLWLAGLFVLAGWLARCLFVLACSCVLFFGAPGACGR